MQKFLSRFWQPLVGLGVGYFLGRLVDVHRTVNYEMLLKYLQAFISFPMAIILIFIVLIAVYKEEFSVLFSRMEGFKGPGFDLAFGMRQQMEAQKETIVAAAVAVTTEHKQEEIEKLDEGAERDEKVEQLHQEEADIRAKILDQVSEVWPQGTFLYSFTHDSQVNAVRVEELRTKIQRPMNRIFRELGIVSSRAYSSTSHSDALTHRDAMNVKWKRGRNRAINHVLNVMPSYIASYGMGTVGAAADSAFQFYMNNGGEPSLDSNSAAS